ncbi:MAG TPA: Gldg family protein [Gammaproteobacteria bacterium]|nr:Gldg family protein [Gammaproteobacteria bacterium]
MSARSRKTYGYTTLALIALAFVVAVVATNAWVRGVRIDLTENNLYTLGEGTQAVLAGIEEPINLYLFFSDEATATLPALRAYAVRVREMLEEFAANSDGKLVLNVVDPVPFSEDEDRAEQFGLQAANVGPAGEAVYFGLAGSNSVGATDTIPFFQPDPRKEAFLEYDLARLVYNLATTDKAVVGLLTAAPIGGGFNPQTQQPSQPWVVVDQAKQLLEVRTLPPSVLSIDKDVDVLWLVHPQMLDDSTLYAVDQFIMRGGRALIFVDPVAEILAGEDPTGLGIGGAASSSTLERLFGAWGVNFNTMSVVTDNRYGLSIGGRFQPVRHIGLIGLDGEAMRQDDPITSGLSSVNLGIAGYFELADGATAKLTPLLTSSVESEAMPADRFQFLPDPADLLKGFTPSGKQYTLAARLEGPLKSAFPDGAPARPDSPDNPNGQQPIDAALSAAHLAATDNANLVLVGDVDILSDRLWVQAQNFLGQRLVTAFANNGDFVINALDNLSGSAALIGLRSRATYTRPFTTVEQLRRRADLQFRETEQRLQAELTQTEQRLGELQQARGDASNSLLMSPEQQAEIQRFLDQQVRIRQELRAVRRNLDADIDRLGTELKVINIALVPVLLTILALTVVVVRRRRKSAS